MSRQKPRIFKASDGYQPADLVHFARDHLFAAKALFELDVRTLDSAGYLSQLGMELLFKALLLHLSGQFPGEHSLQNLYGKVQRVQPSFKIPNPYSDVLPLLDRYYELRYSAPSNLPGVAKGDWPVIAEVVRLIDEQLPAELRETVDSSSAKRKAGRKIIRRREDIWK